MIKLVSWAYDYLSPRRQTPTEAPRLAKSGQGDRALVEALWEAEALWFDAERLKRQAVIEETTPDAVAEWTAASDRRAWSRRMHDAKRAKNTK
jgi:hypothetical protein